jgi:DNA-binding NtrC family response regulator
MSRILIVDDEPTILCVLSNLLQSEGYEVTGTLRGDRARSLLRRDKNIKLLLTDIRMDPVTGTELLASARKDRPDVPVIVVTAYCAGGLAEEARRLGAYAYLCKPWDVDELLSVVKQALESAS